MSNDENLIEPNIHEAEESIDRMLRPKYLSEYVGQEPVKQQMEIFIEAAKNRQESLDHVLIFGSIMVLIYSIAWNLFLRRRT